MRTDRLRTACTLVNNAGTLNVSKNICAATSRLARGFRGASVNSTGCFNAFSQTPVATLTQRPTYLLAQGAQFFCVYPVPYAFHVVPVCDDPVLDRILDLEETSVLLCASAYECVTLERACHYARVFGAAHALARMSL